MESESARQPGNPSSHLLSQERLIRKAAGLSHFLINEVAVAPVSPAYSIFITPNVCAHFTYASMML